MARTSRLSTSSLKLISESAETCSREIDRAETSTLELPTGLRRASLLLFLSQLAGLQKQRAVQKAARQALVEERSIRPAPGTSDLLCVPFSVNKSVRVSFVGKVVEVETHDLIELAPMHLLGGKVDRKSRR